MFRDGLKAHQTERKRLVSTITANEDNAFGEDELEAMETNTLRKLAGLARKPAGKKESGQASYFGATGGDYEAPTDNSEEEPLEMPTMNWDDED